MGTLGNPLSQRPLRTRFWLFTSPVNLVLKDPSSQAMSACLATKKPISTTSTEGKISARFALAEYLTTLSNALTALPFALRDITTTGLIALFARLVLINLLRTATTGVYQL